MATIDDVIKWANTLPAWQGDAVRRLLVAGEHPLSDEDYAEILALAKAHLKLAPDPDKVKPTPPSAGTFSGVPGTTVAIKLVSMDDVRNVNIIKPGQTQPFAETGVTVVYGGNGTGKSGYARILKLACQARDKEDHILPNVFAAAPSGPPTATLKIKQNGASKDIPWIQGAAPDPLLTNISVFDGRCARVITDARNEISYLPYGADVFQKMADLVQRIKDDLEAEMTALEPVQDSAVAEGTPSAIFLASLSETTKDDDINSATIWTPQDQEELTAKEELARSSDPTKSTQEIARLDKIKGHVNVAATTAAALLSNSAAITNEAIRNVLAELAAAQLAYATAVAARQTPEPLPGIASTDQWEILYKAAKRYSEELAYPGEPFPKTTDAVCVLCQQPLSAEAVARFTRFKNFMEDATSTVLTAKRSALSSLREQLEDLVPLSDTALESVCDEITTLGVEAGEALRLCHTGIAARKAAALALLKEGESSDKAMLLPPWPASPQALLQALARILTQRTVDIANAAKPDEYKKLILKVAEFKSRKALSLRKPDITKFVINARRNGDLSRAAATLRTQEITRYGTALIRKNLTPDLLNAFRDELSALGSTRVSISVKPTGAGGETAHEMLLDGVTTLGKARLSQVLSEGEARVIAIAGFLAELQLAKHANAIVFDDPVSSLDHEFTAKIAARLAREGLTRQVIAFTHNIAFLMELQDASEDLAKAGTPVALTVHTLRRDATTAGITTDGAPWYALNVNQRAHHLDQLVLKIKPVYHDNKPDYNKQAAYIYGLLREAWESCVEDDLFYSVVCRYRNSVQTLKLLKVSIEDTDIHDIDRHMTKASTWMTGHDKSKALDHDRPAPDELLADIATLRTFSDKIKQRRGETEKRRKALLKP